MAATIQNNPIMLQQEDEDVAIANYISTSMRFDQSQDLWSYQQQSNNPYNYQHISYQQHQRSQNARPRTTNPVMTPGIIPLSHNPAIITQKSLSTPISTTRSRKSHHQLTRPQFNNNLNSSNNMVNINPNYNSSNVSVSSTSSTNKSSSRHNKGDYSSSQLIQNSNHSYSHNNSTSSVNSTNPSRPKSAQFPSKSMSSSSASDTSRRRSMNSNIALSSNDIYQHRRPSTASSVISSSAISTQSGLSVQSSVSYQSTFSNQSAVTVNTKTSFSKRIRKVFSMNSLKSSKDLNSLREKNGSEVSIQSTVTEIQSSLSTSSSHTPLSFRRRSIASLSSLFHKDSSSVQLPPASQAEVKSKPSQSNSRRHSSGDLRQMVKEDKKKKPELIVNTDRIAQKSPQVRKGVLKTRSAPNGTTPDSPNSAVSSRSFTRLPPPQQQSPHRVSHYGDAGLPSPTPSSSSSSHNNRKINFEEIDNKLINMTPPVIGLHYGIGLHSSPKLKPASSSSSSLGTSTMPERRIQFCSTIQVHETFSAGDYDRRCDSNATCQKLTPIVAMKIKQELNEYKLTDMKVHVESRQYTHFFL